MKHPLTVRLTPEARAALAKLAQRDSRSMSSYIENAVRQEALKQGVWVPRVLTAVKTSV